jgi:hypothetical protein
MRRIVLFVVLAVVFAAMIGTSVVPALADPPPNKKGQYTCFVFDPTTVGGTTYRNVPQGQTANYTFSDPATGAFGYCYSNK